MQKIIFLKGLPASGKTTWAKKYLIENLFVDRVNKDDIREELGNPEWTPEFEEKVKNIEIERGLEILKKGYSLIVDDTNLNPLHQIVWNNIANNMGIRLEERFFDVSMEEALARNLKREKPLKDEVITSMYEKYIKKEVVKVDSRFTAKQDLALPRCIICDIDGTLSLMNGRHPFDEAKYETDRLNVPVFNILVDYAEMQDVSIILVSGRMETGRSETEQWLFDHEVPYDMLVMRESKDYRPDDIVKKELYEKYIKDKFYVDFVLDDRNSVVAMWRSLGLLCLQVYYGDF